MSDLADVLPEFARQHELVRRDLSEKQAKMFEEWSEREERRRLAEINKLLTAANDAQPNAAADNPVQPNPDLVEFQKAMDLKGETAAAVPSPETHIKNARDI